MYMLYDRYEGKHERKPCDYLFISKKASFFNMYTTYLIRFIGVGGKDLALLILTTFFFLVLVQMYVHLQRDYFTVSLSSTFSTISYA